PNRLTRRLETDPHSQPADRAGAAFLAAVACLAVAVGGCGQSDLVFPGEVMPTANGTPGTPGASTETPAAAGAAPTATPTPVVAGCAPSGGNCAFDTDCCDGQCVSPDGFRFTCH